VARSDIPDRFRAVTILYLETYATRISDVYATTRHKVLALGHFWRFLDQQYPEIEHCADILPVHARAPLSPTLWSVLAVYDGVV
jgi:hypothetical protein